MQRVDELADVIRELSGTELAELKELIAEIEAEAWDRQIERDALAGKLDWLVEEAREEHRAGLTTPL